ncbi:MAG TPA: hypothetical protein VH396_10490 [Chitinophagaceae bacterium]|jgi:hypothetical protein
METIIFNEAGVWIKNLKLTNLEISEPGKNEVQMRILEMLIFHNSQNCLQKIFQ